MCVCVRVFAVRVHRKKAGLYTKKRMFLDEMLALAHGNSAEKIAENMCNRNTKLCYYSAFGNFSERGNAVVRRSHPFRSHKGYFINRSSTYSRTHVLTLLTLLD